MSFSAPVDAPAAAGDGKVFRLPAVCVPAIEIHEYYVLMDSHARDADNLPKQAGSFSGESTYQ
jgi:hypothetical protein